METATTRVTRRIAKPLGVIILTAFDGVFIGLVPLLVLLFLDSAVEISRLDYYLTAFLRIMVIAGALGAFMGENAGRLVLLWAVTAVSVLTILSAAGFFLDADDENSERLSSIGSILRGLFWIALNWWYLNRKGVVDYFKQNQRAKDQTVSN